MGISTTQIVRWLFSITVASTLIFGSASHAFAKPPVHEEKVDVLVSFTGKPGPAEQALIENEGGKVKRKYHAVPAVAASIPKGKLDSLRRNPKVTSVEEDITVQVIEETLPWGVDRIDAEMVHSQNKGRGTKIAVLDTGIDLDHPDLRVAGNVSFDSAYGTIVGDDDHGHGTMVAGVLSALDNDIGVVGVAPEAELYAVKVLNRDGWGMSSDILSGVEWAIDNNMQVINMSFGCFLNLPQAVRAALDRAYQSGIVLVAGAGNAGDQDIIFSPARYEPVIAVGATDQQDARASFSSTGSTLELVAPGTDIISTSRGGGYSSGGGTSLSTPHVAGAAALLIASGITSNIQVRQILRNTAEDLGPAEWDSWYGYGLVSASEALGAALSGTTYSDDRSSNSEPTDSGEGDSNNEPTDMIPPTTRIEISGLLGNGDWHCSDVIVDLTAVDNPGGAGVIETVYSLDGGKTWWGYHGPFTIAQEGSIVIHARSRDNAGNIEEPTPYRQVKIDKTGPSVSISVAPSVIWPANHKQVMVNVLVTSSASDKLSGLNSFHLAMKDEYGQVEPVIGSYLQRQIQLEAWRDSRDLDGRVYTVSIVASDYAGNTATAETTVTVPHDRRKEGNNENST